MFPLEFLKASNVSQEHKPLKAYYTKNLCLILVSILAWMLGLYIHENNLYTNILLVIFMYGFFIGVNNLVLKS